MQLSEIRQIEVVKGPNSALFGFNAVGGVVNIITQNPKFDSAGSVNLTGGTNGYGELSVVVVGEAGRSLLRPPVGRGGPDGRVQEHHRRSGQSGPDRSSRVSANLDTILPS